MAEWSLENLKYFKIEYLKTGKYAHEKMPNTVSRLSKEMQLKSEDTSIPVRMANNHKDWPYQLSILVRMQRNWNSCGTIEWFKHFEKQFSSFLKVKHKPTTLPNHFTSTHLPKGKEKKCTCKDLCKCLWQL